MSKEQKKVVEPKIEITVKHTEQSKAAEIELKVDEVLVVQVDESGKEIAGTEFKINKHTWNKTFSKNKNFKKK